LEEGKIWRTWKLNGLEVNAQLTRWFVSFAEFSCYALQSPRSRYEDGVLDRFIYLFIIFIFLRPRYSIPEGWKIKKRNYSYIYLFIYLFICQQEYEKTAGPICMKFSGKAWSDHGTTWLTLGQFGQMGRRVKGQFFITGHSYLVWLLSSGSPVLPSSDWECNEIAVFGLLLHGKTGGGVCCASHHCLL